MEKIKDTQYYTVYYDRDNELAEIAWKQTTEELEVPDGFKEQIESAHRDLLDIKPKYLLHNVKNAVFPFNPDVIQWIAEKISKDLLVKLNVKRLAYVLSEDDISKLSLSLILSKGATVNPNIARSFHDERDKAINWLLSDTSS